MRDRARTAHCTFTGTIPPSNRSDPSSRDTDIRRLRRLPRTGSPSPARATRRPLGPEPLHVTAPPTPFGVQPFEMEPEGEGRHRRAQAGSHPFQLTTTLDLNQTLGSAGKPGGPSFPSVRRAAAELALTLPPGLIGDPTSVPRCSEPDFFTIPVSWACESNLCPRNGDRCRPCDREHPDAGGRTGDTCPRVQPGTGRRRTGPVRVRRQDVPVVLDRRSRPAATTASK